MIVYPYVAWKKLILLHYVRYVHPSKCWPHSQDTDRNTVCNEGTAGMKAFLALDCFYFLEYITEHLHTKLLCWMLHGCQLPGFLKRLVRNIHTNIPEDLCNLWRQGWEMSASENRLTQTRSSYNCKIDAHFYFFIFHFDLTSLWSMQQRNTYSDHSRKRAEWLWDRLEKVKLFLDWSLKFKQHVI